ncbi:hypothetical protein VNO77_00544 [Canavalia gladiata]|uniref:Uncharacterized protein n=1 Tax=Canavalia gladiata TaxID=3824 RepID=A0AAN9R5E5_CANGL
MATALEATRKNCPLSLSGNSPPQIPAENCKASILLSIVILRPLTKLLKSDAIVSFLLYNKFKSLFVD